MKRKQIYIAEDQESQLKQAASEQGRSEAALIREALEDYLSSRSRKPKALRSMREHPLWRLMGIATSPDAPIDGAENHDHYLYGAPKAVD